MSMQVSMGLTFLLTALWWFLVTIPLLRQYKQVHYVENHGQIWKRSFGRLWKSLKEMRKEKHIFMFLLAFFFYIDGVYTIIEMATAYGQSLGLDKIRTFAGAFGYPAGGIYEFCLIFAKLAKRFSGTKLITVCIVAYFCIAVYVDPAGQTD